MAKKKRSASKKLSPRKKSASKKSASKKSAPLDRIPCICVKANGRWFCMKEENGSLIQCDGPFATKSECEEHVCI